MELYFGEYQHVQQEYGVHLRLASGDTPKPRNSQPSKAGSYGVSIRVQGIDGHPYIVLNNTERCLAGTPFPENAPSFPSSVINNLSLHPSNGTVLKENTPEELQLPENPYLQTSPLRGQKQFSLHEGRNGVLERKDGPTKLPHVLNFQKQLGEYKEKNRRELAEMQTQLKEKCLEVEKARLAASKMQDELRLKEEELQDYQRAEEEALTKRQLLEQSLKDLEYELEAKSHLKDDRSRLIKQMEDKVSQLEIELEEERTNADLLSERITWSREQMEQMRSELLQEKAAKQDLECDKISLERQNKDLKSRIIHLEGSYRSSKEGLVVQMEARIAELEDRLENEERDRANLQLSNRRLERKVKELVMQVDDEHLSLTDQKDQLSLRLKAMKRQVEEAEEEIDRLESSKKKLQRELEEQMGVNEQLQGQLNSLKKGLRLKTLSSKVLDDSDDDDLSSDAA